MMDTVAAPSACEYNISKLRPIQGTWVQHKEQTLSFQNSSSDYDDHQNDKEKGLFP